MHNGFPGQNLASDALLGTRKSTGIQGAIYSIFQFVGTDEQNEVWRRRKDLYNLFVARACNTTFKGQRQITESMMEMAVGAQTGAFFNLSDNELLTELYKIRYWIVMPAFHKSLGIINRNDRQYLEINGTEQQIITYMDGDQPKWQPTNGKDIILFDVQSYGSSVAIDAAVRLLHEGQTYVRTDRVGEIFIR